MKEEIRKSLLYKRVNQSPRDKEPKDLEITKKIEEIPEFQKAENILIYASIHGEVYLGTLFEKHKENKIFVLPKVNQGEAKLDLYKVQSFSELKKGSYEVLEPQEEIHEEIVIDKIDLVIVPGIAYTLDGHRIGYGGGYYDKLLKKMDCPKIGVAYQFQIIENIEAEDHDETVDIIITEDNTTHIKTP